MYIHSINHRKLTIEAIALSFMQPNILKKKNLLLLFHLNYFVELVVWVLCLHFVRLHNQNITNFLEKYRTKWNFLFRC